MQQLDVFVFVRKPFLLNKIYCVLYCILPASWNIADVHDTHAYAMPWSLQGDSAFCVAGYLFCIFFPRRTYLSVSGGHGSNGTVPMVVASILQVLVWHVFFARVPGLRSPITWADCVGKHAKITNHLLQVSNTCSAKCGFEVRNMSKDSN